MIVIVLVGGKQAPISSHPELPYSLIPVAGEPFLYWLTIWLKTQGFTHIVYSAGHFSEKIALWANHIASREPSLCVDVVTEARPLGTGGAATYCAKRFPSECVCVINGDSLLLTPVAPAIQKLKNNDLLDAIIFGTNITNAGRFDTLELNNSNHLTAFKKKQPGKGPINAGLYVFRHTLLSDISPDKEVSLEYDCFPNWLAQAKRIEVIEDPAPFIDIGTPEALKRAHEQVRQYQPLIFG